MLWPNMYTHTHTHTHIHTYPPPSRYDVDLDGYIDFHEFLQNVLQEAELDQDCNAQRRVQAR